MPQPPQLNDSQSKQEQATMGADTPNLSKEGEALNMMISYLEDWTSQQSVILKETIKTIVAAKAALPMIYTCNDTMSTRHSDKVRKLSDRRASEQRASGRSVTLIDRTASQGNSKSLEGFENSTPQCCFESGFWQRQAPLLTNRIGRLCRYAAAKVNVALARFPLPGGCLARAIRGKVFEMILVGVILSNVLVLISSTDIQIQNALSGSNSFDDTFFFCDIVFTAVYTLELLCRLYAYRIRFLFTSEWKWNLLDTLLTIVAIQDVVLFGSSSQLNQGNLNFLRLVRLMKLLKTLRLLRVLRAFRDLRMMLNSIVGSIYVMAYALVLLVVIMFAFGIFLSQGVGLYLLESTETDTAEQDLLVYYWGSVSISMASLYYAVLGGENWRTMADSLAVLGETFRLAFFAFVAFFLLVIVNTITSVFVESAIQAGEQDSVAQIKEEMDKKNKYVRQLRNLFGRMDLNHDGQVDFDELVASLETEEMIAFLSKLMIDVHDAKQFLKEMSVQGQTNIDLDSFVTKCLKIRGPARSIDLISFASAQQSMNSVILSDLSTLMAMNEMIQMSLVGS